MRYALFLLFVIGLSACETHAFDSDKRQILAKDEISRKIPRNRSLSIIAFKEDTLENWQDSTFQHPIRYTLDFSYNDSTGARQNKTCIVIFAPDGNTILNTQIVDRP